MDAIIDDPLADYPVVVDQAVDWADMDLFGHVNNVVYFRYFENVRVEYFQRIGFWDMLRETGIGPIVASTQARFRRAVQYPDTLRAGAKLVAISEDRFTLKHALVSRTTGELKTEGDAVVVAYDYRAKRKTTIPNALRQAIESLTRSVDSNASGGSI
jgi:acyl-CoA thioester hydrolase